VDKNKNKIGHLAFKPLGSFSHMATYRSSSNITRKMNLIEERKMT
jgi:hypothetical protein